jgi:hypothetical protein
VLPRDYKKRSFNVVLRTSYLVPNPVTPIPVTPLKSEMGYC